MQHFITQHFLTFESFFLVQFFKALNIYQNISNSIIFGIELKNISCEKMIFIFAQYILFTFLLHKSLTSIFAVLKNLFDKSSFL